MHPKHILSRLALSAFIAAALLLPATQAQAKSPALSPPEAQDMMQNDRGFVILDVRNPEELASGYYPGSINIPLNELEKRADELPAGKTVLIHCARGIRARTALKILREKRPDLPNILYIAGQPIF